MFLLTACLEVNAKPQTSYYLSSVFREERLNCANGSALGVYCTASSGERRCTLKWERFTNTGKYTHMTGEPHKLVCSKLRTVLPLRDIFVQFMTMRKRGSPSLSMRET